MRGPPQSFTWLRSQLGAYHHPTLCRWHHLRRGLSSVRRSQNLRCWPVQPGGCSPSLTGNHAPWSTWYTLHICGVLAGNRPDSGQELLTLMVAIHNPPPSHHGLGGGCSWAPWSDWLSRHWPPGGSPPVVWIPGGPGTMITSASSLPRSLGRPPASRRGPASWIWMEAILTCLDCPSGAMGPIRGSPCPSLCGPGQWGLSWPPSGRASPACLRRQSKLSGQPSVFLGCKCRQCSRSSSSQGIDVDHVAYPVGMHSPGWRPGNCANSGVWMPSSPVYLDDEEHPLTSGESDLPVPDGELGQWSQSWLLGWGSPCPWTCPGPPSDPRPGGVWTTNPNLWRNRVVQSMAPGSSWSWMHWPFWSARLEVPGWPRWVCNHPDWYAGGHWTWHCRQLEIWPWRRYICPGQTLERMRNPWRWWGPLPRLSSPTSWWPPWMGAEPCAEAWCWFPPGLPGWFSSSPWGVPGCPGRGGQTWPRTTLGYSISLGVCVVWSPGPSGCSEEI